MEGKTLILSVLVMSLLMAQIQVDAKICCPSTTATNIYNACRLSGRPREICLRFSGCKFINGPTCPYRRDILENTGDAVDEYCKVGCISSVCGALATIQNSDASEIMNGAVEKCVMACSTTCTKGSRNAVATA